MRQRVDVFGEVVRRRSRQEVKTLESLKYATSKTLDNSMSVIRECTLRAGNSNNEPQRMI